MILTNGILINVALENVNLSYDLLKCPKCLLTLIMLIIKMSCYNYAITICHMIVWLSWQLPFYHEHLLYDLLIILKLWYVLSE